MQITVGLDFGTHQTKVCVEEKDRFETKYTFVPFKNNKGEKSYTLPSVIRINDDNTLSYGYLQERDSYKKIIRYFKQATFTENSAIWNDDIEPVYYTIWYIAYVLFDLERRYGEFPLNMGIPTDIQNLYKLKVKAINIIGSAYRLVEDVFKKDVDSFLLKTVPELMEITKIETNTLEIRKKYELLIFPEAYACLRPLASKGKLNGGMNLMVDIGGGTTDISFFNLESVEGSKKIMPHIYELMSLPMGLNYLTKAEERLNSSQLNSNLSNSDKFDAGRESVYIDKINDLCYKLRTRLISIYEQRAELGKSKLLDNLNRKRPIIYTGGGSTFESLRRAYGDFADVYHITSREWGTNNFEDTETITKLCPILSTVFGLSISAVNDSIPNKPLIELFDNCKWDDEDEGDAAPKSTASSDYHYDWMNKDYGVITYGTCSSSSKKKQKRAHQHRPDEYLYVPKEKDVCKKNSKKNKKAVSEFIESRYELRFIYRPKVWHYEGYYIYSSFLQDKGTYKHVGVISNIEDVKQFIYNRISRNRMISTEDVQNAINKIKDKKLARLTKQMCQDCNAMYVKNWHR